MDPPPRCRAASRGRLAPVALGAQRHVMATCALAAALAMAVGVLAAKPAAARAWLLFAGGLGAAGIGFWAQPHGQHNVAGNVCWLATGALVLAGLVAFVLDRRIGARGAALVDAGILATAAALLNWLFAFE